MRSNRILLVLVALSACSGGDKQAGGKSTSQPPETFAIEGLDSVRLQGPDFDAKGNRIYTNEELSVYPLTRYRKFPTRVGKLMRRSDAENDWCRGGSGNIPETWQACNRREILGWRIEMLGYCWGSPNPSPSEAERGWIKCSVQPNYSTNKPVPKPSLYSNAEIEETTGLRSVSETGWAPKR